MDRGVMGSVRIVWLAALVAVGSLAGCGDEEPARDEALSVGDPCPEGACDDLTSGPVIADQKTDGDWTQALRCKEIPEVEPLNDPMIIVSLDGLTARLFDRAGDYERVFPIGPGAVSSETGFSLTPTSTHLPEGLFHTRTEMPAVTDNTSVANKVWAWNYKCRFWGEDIPYFAGLPFIRLEGTDRAVYGFHGPIDKFTTPSGGELRRGFVSHGCVRMSAEDIVELWGRLQGHKAPVRIQRAFDRREDGTVVDVADNWLLAECAADADCRYDGGICRQNAWSGRGYCTKTCDGFCDDRRGYPGTMCAPDPDGGEGGICVPASDATTRGCARYGSFIPTEAASLGNGRVREVCLPGSPGTTGSPCLQDVECGAEGRCMALGGAEEGVKVCAPSCEALCQDTLGAPSTFCVDAGLIGGQDADGGACAAQCDLDADCPLGASCAQAERLGQSGRTSSVCLNSSP